MGKIIITEKNRNIWAIAIAAVVVVLIVAGAIFHTQIKNQLNDWKVLPQPEHLTELYFNNSSKLPTYYIPGQAQYVSFTVHNLEYKTMTYNYTVTAQVGKEAITQLLSGSFTLAQNQYKRVPVDVIIPDLGSRVLVGVNLAIPSQSINYWVNRAGS